MTGTRAYINAIVTAVPAHEVHQAYIDKAKTLLSSERDLVLFEKLVARSGIASRFSVLREPFAPQGPAGEGFYSGACEPTTQARMKAYERHAPEVSAQTLAGLLTEELRDRITHLVLTSCTGFYAPGLDVDLVETYKLRPDVERTIVGFMGCHAAINGLKVADYIVRANPQAVVLLVNLELCSLHFRFSSDLEQLLCFLQFADGCAASIISAEPSGIAIEGFFGRILPDSRDQMRWTIRDLGFDMYLSSDVPAGLRKALGRMNPMVPGTRYLRDIPLWAIHPGGRSILDAVQSALELSDEQLLPSRTVLRRYGNMSSPSIMFILGAMLSDQHTVGRGCAMAFGPGLALEGFVFDKLPRS